jgi:hypothetical protein
MHKRFKGGNFRERGHLENLGLDWRIILKWIFEKWDRGMYWIDMAQDRDMWRAVVNAVMNLRVPKNAGNFLSSLHQVSYTSLYNRYPV